jgi:hypothetical protein
MVDKIHGFVAAPDQSLVGAVQFYTVSTANNIVTVTNGDNAYLDTLVNAISTRAQPVILGTPSGTGPYTLRFAVEHAGVLGNLTAFQNEVIAITGDSALTVTAFTL